MVLPTSDDVRQAAQVLHGHAHRTPVLTSRRLDALTGGRLFFKAENFQRVGAFKFRGAFTAVSALDAHQRRAGVVAYSSGNHAQAIALACRELGVPATIVMPFDAPAAKVAATRGYGATVVQYDRYTQDREQIGAELAERDGLTLIPPYNHPKVIAGQGTVVRELLQDVGPLDLVVTPLGGGGLLSGSILACRELAPDAALVGVEPEAGDDAQRSLAQGRIVHIDTPRTIADGAQTQHLGELTFAILSAGVREVVTVPDAALVEAMRQAAQTLKVVIEPTAALGLAAVLTGVVPVADARVGIVLSGGNVDPARYAELLAP